MVLIFIVFDADAAESAIKKTRTAVSYILAPQGCKSGSVVHNFKLKSGNAETHFYPILAFLFCFVVIVVNGQLIMLGCLFGSCRSAGCSIKHDEPNGYT